MTENEMRELFREMREEPVPADSLARVRLGVEQRVGQRSRRSWWKFAVPLAAAGCIVVGFLVLRPARTPAPVVKQIEQPRLPEVAQVIPPPELPVRTVSHPRRARPAPVEGAAVLIRIETPDPDVVILFVN